MKRRLSARAVPAFPTSQKQHREPAHQSEITATEEPLASVPLFPVVPVPYATLCTRIGDRQQQPCERCDTPHPRQSGRAGVTGSGSGRLAATRKSLTPGHHSPAAGFGSVRCRHHCHRLASAPCLLAWFGINNVPESQRRPHRYRVQFTVKRKAHRKA